MGREPRLEIVLRSVRSYHETFHGISFFVFFFAFFYLQLVNGLILLHTSKRTGEKHHVTRTEPFDRSGKCGEFVS